jgi:ABC-2 type transport system ATP-binding protein
VIRSLKEKGKTIILTTHYLDEAQQLSDRVAIMDHGKIVATGTSDEIIKQYGSGERLEIRGSDELADYIRANTQLNVTHINGEISIQLEQKTDALIALEAAESSKLEWADIRTRRDSLDDVFVKLVSGVVDEHGELKQKNPRNDHVSNGGAAK